MNQTISGNSKPTVAAFSKRTNNHPMSRNRRRTATLSAFETDPQSEAEYQAFKSKQWHQKDAPCIEALIELALAIQKIKPDWFEAAKKTSDRRAATETQKPIVHAAYRMRQDLLERVEAYAATYHKGNGSATSAELFRIGLLLLKRDSRLLPASITEHAEQFIKLTKPD